MNKNGFTLIELLVVVAIIGIIAAVGTVAYTGYNARAKDKTLKYNHDLVLKFLKLSYKFLLMLNLLLSFFFLLI